MKRAHRVHVDSTTLRWLAYEPARRQLDIAFRQSDDVYRYFDVTAAEYAEFLAAESKGTYLNQIFKLRKHRFILLRRGAR